MEVLQSRPSEQPAGDHHRLKIPLLVLGLIAALALIVFGSARHQHELRSREHVSDSLYAVHCTAVWGRVDSLAASGGLKALSSVTDEDLAIALESADAGLGARATATVLHQESDRREQLRQAHEDELEAQAVADAAERRADGILLLASSEAGVGRRNTAEGTLRPRVVELATKYPDWSDRAVATVACSLIELGLTGQQVTESWGAPDRVRRHVRRGAVMELWVYEGWSETHVHFQDGVVIGWTD